MLVEVKFGLTKYLLSEVTSYIEELILDDRATDDEIEFYNECMEREKIDTRSNVYKRIKMKMDKLYEDLWF